MSTAANRVSSPGISWESQWESEASGLIERIRRITWRQPATPPPKNQPAESERECAAKRSAERGPIPQGGSLPANHAGAGREASRARPQAARGGRNTPTYPIRPEQPRTKPCKAYRPAHRVAVGYPAGPPAAASVGVVHAVAAETWIEADIRLAPGNSGGPLADVAGRVVGVNSMVANGMGIAVSVAAIERFWRQVAARSPGVAS